MVSKLTRFTFRNHLSRACEFHTTEGVLTPHPGVGSFGGRAPAVQHARRSLKPARGSLGVYGEGDVGLVWETSYLGEGAWGPRALPGLGRSRAALLSRVELTSRAAATVKEPAGSCPPPPAAGRSHVVPGRCRLRWLRPRETAGCRAGAPHEAPAPRLRPGRPGARAGRAKGCPFSPPPPHPHGLDCCQLGPMGQACGGLVHLSLLLREQGGLRAQGGPVSCTRSWGGIGAAV